jgi:hypothetical protein
MKSGKLASLGIISNWVAHYQDHEAGADSARSQRHNFGRRTASFTEDARVFEEPAESRLLEFLHFPCKLIYAACWRRGREVSRCKSVYIEYY